MVWMGICIGSGGKLEHPLSTQLEGKTLFLNVLAEIERVNVPEKNVTENKWSRR
jgi:hypothetical protein